MSLIEAIANIAVGYSIAVAMQILAFPLFGLDASLGENLALGALFTIASVCRSFALRRAFEALRVRPTPLDLALLRTSAIGPPLAFLHRCLGAGA